MVNRSRLLTVVTLILANACVPAQAPPPTLHLICLPGVPLPVLIAKAQGFFAREGIEVIAEKATDAAALRTALSNHTADLAHASVENAVVAATSGGTDAVIVIGGEESTSEVIVQPSIHTVNDLRGKTVILDGEDTAYTLLLRKILLRKGIRPGVDCQMKVIGLAPDRLAAMREHPEYAATVQKPPTSILSEQAGLRSLGSTGDLSGMGSFQGIGGFVLRSWARDHADLIERYLAAFVEGQRWMMDPAHRDQVVALIMSQSHTSRDIAEQTYDVGLHQAWSPDAQFDVGGFRNVLALDRESTAPAAAQPEPNAFYDLSWYRNALKRAAQSQ
jgi:ABC-type nitrate/sulfonate/bicarbonate transport system substrate-binding protein